MSKETKVKCWIDKENPGIIRFADGDKLMGILAGIRAPGIVNAINAHDELVEALELWEEFWDKMPKGQLGKISCDIGILNKAFIKTASALKAAGVQP